MEEAQARAKRGKDKINLYRSHSPKYLDMFSFERSVNMHKNMMHTGMSPHPNESEMPFYNSTGVDHKYTVLGHTFNNVPKC